MHTLTEVAAVQARCLAWRAEGLVVGFVPTMGFLHRGHASLMDLAVQRCDRLVVSIFVNPIQFGPGEDLDRYPRDPEGDAQTCEEHGCDLLFSPVSLYPPGFSTRVSLSGVTDGLCGARRPGHFEGVTTVVARLFGIVQPHVAVFGEKDYQQLQVLRAMTRDLAMPIEILGGALIRDDDGLALSSRNAYLTPRQRQQGLSLHRALFAMRSSGIRDVEELKALGGALLDVDRIDYLDVVDAEDLGPLDTVDRPARALVAAFVGETRLIDNVGL
ncbi:MAG TPA: pantoate--beta-alanine ligase [Myxococcota bacterium]|nr:pantoate--beta-alanine ligase [Myxococcota bacterium]